MRTKDRPPRLFNDNKGTFIVIRKKKKKVKKYINTNIEKSILTNIFVNTRLGRKKRARKPTNVAVLSKIGPSMEANLPPGLRTQLQMMRLQSWLTHVGPLLQGAQVSAALGQRPGNIVNVNVPGAQAAAAAQAPAQARPRIAPQMAQNVVVAPLPRARANVIDAPLGPAMPPAQYEQFRAQPPQEPPRRTTLQLFPEDNTIRADPPGPIPQVAPGQPGPTTPQPPLVTLVDNNRQPAPPAPKEEPRAETTVNMIEDNTPAATRDSAEKIGQYESMIQNGQQELANDFIQTVEIGTPLNTPILVQLYPASTSTKARQYEISDLINIKNDKEVWDNLARATPDIEIRDGDSSQFIMWMFMSSKQGRDILKRIVDDINAAKQEKEKTGQTAAERRLTKEDAKEVIDDVVRSIVMQQSKLGNGSKRPRRGLWDYEINEIMAQYKKYGWLGCVSADQVKGLDPGKHKTVSCIVNTSPTNKPGRHWTAIFIDIGRDKSANFFDSFGVDPEPEIAAGTKALVDKMKPRTLLRYRINRVRSQSWSSDTCGWQCIRWLADMYAGVPFADATGFNKIIHAPKMGEARVAALKAQIKKFGYI